MVTNVDGFTRDADLVAFLVFANGRVTQYELRHQHRIKNPAQAVNDAEATYRFELETGDALPNGDIPYTLKSGRDPSISGTIPLFSEEVLEDPDTQLYVRALDFYECLDCMRHPVYKPVVTPDDDIVGVCPRHGPAIFRQIGSW